MEWKSKTPYFPIAFSLALGFILCSASSCGGAENGQAKEKAVTTTATTHPVESTSEVQSGPFTITGNMPSSAALEGKWVYLYETEGKDIFVIDSAQITSGTYAFDLKKADLGLYRIGTSKNISAMGEIIIDPRNKSMSLSHASPTFVSRVDFGESKENKALMSYRILQSKYSAKLGNIRRSKQQRSEKLKQIYALDGAFKVKQDSLAALHTGTFFANMVSHLQSPKRFDKGAYWNDLDFKDESLIHSTVYADRIEDYMRTHASKENTKEDKYKGFYNAVDQIAATVKAGGNDRVLEFMLYTMSEGFYKSNLEEVSHYVIDSYFYGDACGDSEISELFKMKAAGIRKLQVGNTPPTFTLPDDKGGMVKSAKIVSENEYTLIVFWASFCHKCEEEIPVIASLHQQYASKGFEVIGVSVDLDANAWKSGIRSKGAPGYNVSDLKGWDGPVTKEYRVSSTPVMFLVDKKGELVLRPKRANQLEGYLKSKL